MTFSPLMSRAYSMLEKNYGSRTGKVSRLIVHHTAGGTESYLIDLFRASKRTAGRSVSVTYVLTRDGRLLGFVPEEYRPWTSGSSVGDGVAVTVEVMTFKSDNYKATDAQLEKLAQLAADLSNRYGWGTLDRKRIMGHREWDSTSCPGPYLWPRLADIAARANEIRGGAPKPAPTPTPTPGAFTVKVTASALNVRLGPGTGYRVALTVKKDEVFTITEVRGDWGRLKSGAGWIHLGYTTRVSSAPAPAPKPARRVEVTASALNVRTGPGTGYRVAQTVKKGEVFTITEVRGDWGRLKSGAGWIHLGYTRNV